MKRVEVKRKRWICAGAVKAVKRQAAQELNSSTWATKRDLEGFASFYKLHDLNPSKFAKATITVIVEWEDKP